LPKILAGDLSQAELLDILSPLLVEKKNARLVFQGTETGEIYIETGGTVRASTAVQPILSLSEVANKISMGGLNAQVRIKGKGEIGILAESIERMTISVKSAIERLQRKREAR
jgi:HAMP domain-containing protein